jgi:hypothetical protein
MKINHLATLIDRHLLDVFVGEHEVVEADVDHVEAAANGQRLLGKVVALPLSQR